MLQFGFSPLVHAYAQSDGFGKLIFWMLFALSGLTWFILLHKFYFLHRIRKLSTHFKHVIDEGKESVLEIPQEKLPEKEKEMSHPFAALYVTLKKKTIEILDKNHFFLSRYHYQEPEGNKGVYLSKTDVESVEGLVSHIIHGEVKKLDSNLFILSTITTLAPFLGLLGTVWGILITFGELQNGASAAANTVILGGLSTALSTTVLGLIVAIPSLIGHSCLKSAIRDYNGDMQDFGNLLLSTIEIQYRKVDLA